MQCDKCAGQVATGEENEFRGQLLCEDCYIDALSPAKPCDPWAVYTARSLSGGGALVTSQQKAILTILEESQGIELEPLAEKLRLRMNDLEREIATLRHMEKIRVVKRDNKKIFKTF
jgi:hypothetical protein